MNECVECYEFLKKELRMNEERPFSRLRVLLNVSLAYHFEVLRLRDFYFFESIKTTLARNERVVI